MSVLLDVPAYYDQNLVRLARLQARTHRGLSALAVAAVGYAVGYTFILIGRMGLL